MTQIQHYDQGGVWVPQATFTVAGVATDPTTITVRVKEPDGTVTVIGPVAGGTGGSGIVRVSAGVFNTLISLDDAGYWHARFEGTGTATGAQEHQAVVDPSEFYENSQLSTRALVSMAETKDWMNQVQQESPDGLELARVINDVSERFHNEAGREFKPLGTNPAVRLFSVEDTGLYQPVYVDGEPSGSVSAYQRQYYVGDLAYLTAVRTLAADWTTVLATVPLSSVTVYPNARGDSDPIRWLELASTVSPPPVGGRLEVTGDWGFPAVPGDVRQAVLDWIAAAVDRDVENYSQDLGPLVTQGAATNVIIAGRSPRVLAGPASSLAVAWSYRDSWNV